MFWKLSYWWHKRQTNHDNPHVSGWYSHNMYCGTCGFNFGACSPKNEGKYPSLHNQIMDVLEGVATAEKENNVISFQQKKNEFLIRDLK